MHGEMKILITKEELAKEGLSSTSPVAVTSNVGNNHKII